MAKGRKRKPYTKVDAMRDRCRLMEDNEFMSEVEIKDRKRKIAAIMYMQNGELIRQQKEEKERGYCPECHLLRNTQGGCPNRCKERAEEKRIYQLMEEEARKKREARQS